MITERHWKDVQRWKEQRLQLSSELAGIAQVCSDEIMDIVCIMKWSDDESYSQQYAIAIPKLSGMYPI